MRQILSAIALAATAAACGWAEPSDAEVRVAERMLTPEELGAGWVDDDLVPPLATPSSLDPPCPFDLPPFDFVVEEIDTADLRSEAEALNVGHTVAVLSDETAAATVQQAWAEMDCTGSDVVASTLDGLPDDMAGVVLRSEIQELVQVVLVTVDGDEIAFLLVSAVDDEAIEVARELADQV